MKKFFENYGFVALISIVVIVLIIIATPVGNSVENATTSMIGSFKNQVDSATNEINNPLRPNSIIELKGRKYVILQNRMNNQYLVMDINGIGNREFNTNGNGQDPSKCGYINGSWKYETCNNQYEGSNIDQYLNGEYYNSLPQEIKDAIVDTNIQQNCYSYAWSNPNYIWISEGDTTTAPGCTGNPCVKQPNGNWLSWDKHIPIKGEPGMHRFKNKRTKHINGLKVNIINRKVYLPSISEISLIANLNDQYDMDKFLRNSTGDLLHMWLRDSHFEDNRNRTVVGSSHDKSLGTIEVRGNGDVTTRPAFVINLSNVEYTNINQQFVK